jgi:hypothetical protein
MAPRIQPISLEDADPETRELLEALSTFRDDDVSILNVFGTLARHPKMLKRWLVFANHVLLKSTISGRDRELAILRTGWRCQAPYEWGQHVVIARRENITDDEIARIAEGPDAPGWSEHDGTTPRSCGPATSCTTRRPSRTPPGPPSPSATTSSSVSTSSSPSGSTTSSRSP